MSVRRSTLTHQNPPVISPTCVSSLDFRDRGNRSSLKSINISFANLNKSPEALRELPLASPRNQILLTCETPTSDKIPLPLNRYHLIYADSAPDAPAPRTCAYVADSIVSLIETYECSRDIVTLRLVDGWTIVASYSDADSSIHPSLLRPIDLKTVLLGDYNAKDTAWFDTRPTDDSGRLARGAALRAWSRRAHTCERGPRLPTRHRAGEIPSKLDLIWTRRDSPHFSIGDYAPLAHSDHSSLHCRFRLIKPPARFLRPRPDYRRMDADLISSQLRTRTPPQNPLDLDNLIKFCLEFIPLITRHPAWKLPSGLLEQRRLVRHLLKKRWGSDQYKIARRTYREELAQYINADIEESLDTAQDPEFFRFTRRHRVNRPVPSLTYLNQCYSGHSRIAKCFADHHGASAPILAPPLATPNIPPSPL